MKISLIAIGQYSNNQIKDLCEIYVSRIKRYNSFDVNIIALKRKEKRNKSPADNSIGSSLILKKIKPSDFVILLDEKGKSINSKAFSTQLNTWFNQSHKQLVFVLGGPFGFSDELRRRGNYLLSLSSFTFSHQHARLVFLEQLYRAFTIMRNEPYHHE